MEKKLLFLLVSLFLTVTAFSQENLLFDGDFESGDAWLLSGGVETNPNMLIEFGNETSPPKYGEGKNLRVHWSNLDQPFDLYIYQKVTLKVGSTYKFSGAIKDAGSDADSKEFWIQIVVIPVNGDEDMSDGPDWATFGTASSILLNFSGWADPGTCSNPLGIDTTFDVLCNNYDGMFRPDIPNAYPNQGDTTIFTVPENIETQINEQYGTMELGPAGTEVEFYFILYPGQWSTNNAANDLDFTFDEFSLTELSSAGISDELQADNISIYPNPTNGIFNLAIDNTINNAVLLSVVDLTGRVVMQKEARGVHINETIDLTNVSNGLYFLKVSNGQETVIKKFIVK